MQLRERINNKQQTKTAANAMMHFFNNKFEIYQIANGEISFHLPQMVKYLFICTPNSLM